MKSKSKTALKAYIKAARKIRREEEIRTHLRPINTNRVHESKKAYNRKRNRADLNKDLPYFLPGNGPSKKWITRHTVPTLTNH